MHLYAFQRARAAFAFTVLTGTVIAAFMLLMILAPLIVRFAERAGFDFFARILSLVAYLWLGLLFLFVFLALVIDAYRLIVYLTGVFLKKDVTALTIAEGKAFLIPLVFSVCICVYGYYEARNIRTEHLIIKTPKITATIGRLRIVQISDVHLGLIVRENRLKRILDKVKEADPDILLSTGDLVDGQIDNLSGLSAMLREVRPRFGKYAITGNHEFYAGLEQALNFTQNAGFRILRGESVIIRDIISIAGVDDPQTKSYGAVTGSSERDLLSGLSGERFTLLLKHRPIIDENALGLFDLQLSGHVHKGQIFPFSIITWLYYPIQAGFAELSEGSRIYVSRGSGTWGPPIRFLSPPEITVIDLVHEGRASH
jgi:hypothetical protein